MANATNGPVDPDAGTNRRGRAERSRAAAEPPASAGPTAAVPPRRRTLSATSTTGRTPVTAPAEPARKTVRAGEETTRRAAGRKSAAEGAGQPVKPAAAVKSTSSRAAAGRSTARKTATAKAPVDQPTDQLMDQPVQQPEETPARPTRRRSTAATETRARRTAGTGPSPAEPERPALTASDREQASPPAEMTRGILELAAERLAASTRPAEPEPRPVAAGDPMAAPGSHVQPRTTGARRSVRSAATGPRAVAGGARPAIGGHPQDTDPGRWDGASARDTDPDRWDGASAQGTDSGRWGGTSARDTDPGHWDGASAQGTDPGRWDGASAQNGWLGLPGTSEGSDGDDDAGVRRAGQPPALDRTDPQPAGNAPGDQYPRIMNRPPIGLPASVRLPAELPDNLWPPKHMLERNLTENIYVPAAVPSRIDEQHTVAELEEAVDDRVHALPAPERHRPAVEAFREDEHEPEPDFLPSVMSREDTDTEYVPAHSRSAATPARHAAGETTGARRVRRRRAMLLTYLLAVVLVLAAGHEMRGEERPLEPAPEAVQRAAEPAVVGPEAQPEPAAPPTAAAETAGASAVEGDGKGTAEAGEFAYAKSRGPILGSAGRLYRFRVAVEKIVEDTAPGEFAEKIDETLGDGRSWTNDGRLRLRRVPKAGDDVDFTIYLASAKTSEQMCATGGLSTEGFTSCRLPEKVIINADRWAGAVPDYDGRIDEYRQYTINHEVGHEFGHGHEACPGEGEKAPVMMQQTFGLKGCTPNAWPYLDGERYSGKPIA